ncbi:MAG: hypothetical protein HGA45_15555, partial [Chloroflexales bacterium]|nr:hypothetical protein [Chloroflexales bacterium]
MTTADKSAAEALPAAGRATLGWRAAALLAALTLVGLGLRLFRLDYSGYWHDEVISHFLALVPAPEIFQSVTASDSHPPLYHILLHYWGALFSYDLVPLRLFSVLTSLLCVPLTYLLGRAVVGPAVGMVAAALMAVGPFQILHGQQARMYPLLATLVLLALLTFLSAWRRGGPWRWALLSLVAAAGFYTHIYFSFSLLGLNLWALYESVRMRRLDRARWAGLLLAQVAAVALFSPFILTMAQLTSSVVENFWIRRNTAVDWLISLVVIISNANETSAAPSPIYILGSYLPPVAALMLTGVVALRAWRGSPEERPALSLLLFAVLTPCLTATLLSLTVRPILLTRSLIGVSGPLYVLLAWAAVRMWARPLTRLLVLAVVLSMALGLGEAYPAQRRPHSLDPAVAYMFAERAPGDAVIVLDWQSFDLTALRHPDAADVYLGCTDESVAAWQRRMALMRWPTPAQVGPPERYAGRYRRVWVLQTPYTYPAPMRRSLPQLVEQHVPARDLVVAGQAPVRAQP